MHNVETMYIVSIMSEGIYCLGHGEKKNVGRKKDKNIISLNNGCNPCKPTRLSNTLVNLFLDEHTRAGNGLHQSQETQVSMTTL